MPSLSVHQQKQRKKAAARRRAGGGSGDASHSAASAPHHPDLVAASAWLSSQLQSAGAAFSALSAAVFNPALLDARRASFASASPFPHLTLRDVLEPSFAVHLLAEVRHALSYEERSSDLFHFHQSADLKAAASPLLSRLRSELYGERFRQLLEAVTAIPVAGLSASVSMSCAVYGDTHRLLCHDDELQGRRIAYILYLVPQDWSERDGGQLDLYSSRQEGRRGGGGDGTPAAAATPALSPVWCASSTVSLVPSWNSLTFFEVSPASFHAVREVSTDAALSPPRLRVSISGWFHGEPRYASRQHRQPALRTLPCLGDAAEWPTSPSSDSPWAAAVSEWLSPTYCQGGGLRSVRRRFQAESSLELRGILHKERYDSVVRALQRMPTAGEEEEEEEKAEDEGEEERLCDEAAEPDCTDSGSSGTRPTGSPRWQWRLRGPLNKFHYQRCAWPFSCSALALRAASAADAEDERALAGFSRFVRSPAFFAWLRKATGLTATAVGGEWRRFGSGHYTLAHDGDEESRREACDVNFSFLDVQPLERRNPPHSTESAHTTRTKKAANGSNQRRPASETGDWDASWGGSVHYIAAGAEAELLSSQPSANTLTLVYRAGCGETEAHGEENCEEDDRPRAVMRFVRYVTRHAPTARMDCDLTLRLAPDDSQQQQQQKQQQDQNG